MSSSGSASGRSLATSLKRALPPAIAAALLFALGRRRAPAVLLAVSVALLALGLLAPRAASRLDDAIARAANAVATFLARSLAVISWIFGVLPAWAWARAWHRSPVGNAWITPESAWTIPPGSARTTDGSPAAAARAGAPDSLSFRRSRGERVARVALAFAIMLVGLVIVAERRGIDLSRWGGDDEAAPSTTTVPEPGATTTAPTRPAGTDAVTSTTLAAPNLPPIPDSVFPTVPVKVAKERRVKEFEGLPVSRFTHEDEPWAPLHFGDLSQLPYAPDFFLGARFADYRSTTVNVSDGRRRTYTPADPELTVWFFGGSTMFGIGQRDDHTIPSVVAKAAEADGIRIRALNFGFPGYVNWQGTERFEQAITSGLPKPDLVVFYDGVNDWGLGSYRVDMGEREVGSITRLPLDDDERKTVFEQAGQPEPMPWSDEREDIEIDLTADQYRRGADIARRLGRHFDIPIVHVWQPSPFAKKRNPVDAPLWKRVDFDPDHLPGSTRHYQLIEERSGVDPIDLTKVLDDVDEPVFFDSSHTNELGARIIGRALYEQLRPALEKAEAAR